MKKLFLAIMLSTTFFSAVCYGDTYKQIYNYDTKKMDYVNLTVSVATGALKTQLTQVGIDTATLRTDVYSLQVSTGVLQQRIIAVGVATGTVKSDILLSTNTYTAPQTFASSVTITNNNFSVGVSTFIVKGGNVGIGVSPIVPLQIVAPAAVRETLFKFSVGDSGDDAVYLGNLTGTVGTFSPNFAGYCGTINSRPSLRFTGFTSASMDAGDTATFGLIDFNAYRTDSATDPLNGVWSNIVNRKLFTWCMNDVIRMTMVPSGNLGIGDSNPQTKLVVSAGVISNNGVGAGITTTGYGLFGGSITANASVINAESSGIGQVIKVNAVTPGNAMEIRNSGGTAFVTITSTGNLIIPGIDTPCMNMSGCVKNKIAIVSSTYTIKTNDYFIDVLSPGNCSIYLPTAVGVAGQSYEVKKGTESGFVTIVPNGTETIDDSTNFVLSAKKNSLKVMSTGTKWIATGGRSLPVVPHIVLISTVTQAVANSTGTYAVTFSTAADIESISFTNNDSKVYFNETGDYLMTISAVIDTTSNTAMKFDLWLKQDGINLPMTNTQVAFNDGSIQQVLSVSYIVDITTVGKYVELWYHGSNTNGRLLYVAETTNPDIPSCPSIIVSINKIGR